MLPALEAATNEDTEDSVGDAIDALRTSQAKEDPVGFSLGEAIKWGFYDSIGGGKKTIKILGLTFTR